MKKILSLLLWLPLIALAQSYPSPTFQNVTVLGTLTAATPTFTNPVPVSSGGTNLATLTAHGIMLGEGTGNVAFAGPSATSGLPLLSSGSSADPAFSTLGLSALSNIGANTLVGNSTGASAAPTAVTVTGCNGAAQALQWTNGTGFGCNSSLATSGANANITSLSGLTTALSVPQGGTGATNFGTHGVLLGEGVGAIGNTATGTSGYVLTSNGASADPSFQAIPWGTPGAIGNVTPSTAIVTSLNGGQLGGRRNPIINSDFSVWQLGTSFTNPGNLTELADRWNFSYNGTVGTLYAVQYNIPTSDWTGDFNFKYGVQLNQAVAGSGNTFYDFSTQIEQVSTFAGHQVTISYWAKSLTTSVALTAIKTEQYFGTGGSPSASVFTTSAGPTLTTTWQRYTTTITLASVAGKTLGTDGNDSLDVIFTLPLNQTFDIVITGVQIEDGPVATPYEGMSPVETLADCQRYTQTSYDNQVAPGTVTSQGAIAFVAGSTSPVFTIQLKTPMRVIPTITYYNPATGAAGSWNDSGTPVTVTTNTNGTKNITVAITGATVGSVITGHYLLRDPSL